MTCMSTAPPVDEPAAMSSTIPLTGNTIAATTAVVTTCFASADCTDSATPTCSGDICVTMSRGQGFQNLQRDHANVVAISVPKTVTVESATDSNHTVALRHRAHGYTSAADAASKTCRMTTVWAELVPYKMTLSLGLIARRQCCPP